MVPFRQIVQTPGWRRSLLVRRAAAAALLLAALVVSVMEVAHRDPPAVVFARDVEAGTALSLDDVAVARVPAHLLPRTALNSLSDIEGQVIVAAAEAGEVATTSKFVDVAFSGGSVGEITNIVPVRLAEPEIVPLSRHGDTVTIVTHRGEELSPEIVAAGGRVLLATTEGTPHTLLVALPHDAARAVAAASLSTPLAVVLTGDRANLSNMD
ncbi:SAF domain protein [Corynebacterium atrinae]|uniref:SAF domain-containing protein n=1 Tax=Corynebacterium atrinae TaxID=1336740 RepID=UPI0025B431C4|nr:SAF domain-containing protein [Corynebacterium atrinae]WJY62825.1 SAF domain protein [Corynebacterium atrinae]